MHPQRFFFKTKLVENRLELQNSRCNKWRGFDVDGIYHASIAS